MILKQTYLDYSKSYEELHSLLEKIEKGENIPNSIIEETRVRLRKFRNLLQDLYSEYIIKQENPESFYSGELKKCAFDYNLAKLEAILHVKVSENELFPVFQDDAVKCLDYLIYPRVTVSNYQYFIAFYSFEQFSDSIVDEDERLLPIIHKIITVGQNSKWYEKYYSPFRKLLCRLPISMKCFNSLKIGIGHKDAMIREEVQEYLIYEYVDEGLADENFNWIK